MAVTPAALSAERMAGMPPSLAPQSKVRATSAVLVGKLLHCVPTSDGGSGRGPSGTVLVVGAGATAADRLAVELARARPPVAEPPVVEHADISDTSVTTVKPTTSRLTIAVYVSVARLRRPSLASIGRSWRSPNTIPATQENITTVSTVDSVDVDLDAVGHAGDVGETSH